MLQNPEKLRPGAILFIYRRNNLISWLIRKLLKFNYSHVAYYLGIGKVLESESGGVEINDFSKYVDNDAYMLRVVDNPLPDDLIERMTQKMLSYLGDKYDYTLLCGHALTSLGLKCSKNRLLRYLDHARGWICSELIAAGFFSAGVALPKSPALMTPKDIYNLLQEDLHYER